MEHRTVKGAKGRKYQVRWTVAGEAHYATFATKALADGHEAKLRTASKEGEAFDVTTGLPISQLTEDRDRELSWYDFACAYVDMKWDEAAPNSRRAIADALATATQALLTPSSGTPPPDRLRPALYTWSFNAPRRAAGPPPDLAPTISWLERNTAPLNSLADPDVLRRVLNQLARKMDGGRAAATVVARKRAVLYNLLGYAVDKKHFAANPLASLSWKSPKTAEAIDRRRVVNPTQAQALLDAVHDQGPMGRHLTAFFGVLYHAGLRPSEAVMLTRDEVDLPDQDNAWGWLNLGDSAPSTGGAWNDSGHRRQPRQLKHRAVAEVRPVPASPALVRLLREHLAEHGTAPDGRLFRGEAGGLLSDSVYSRAWDKARHTALTEAEAASPLGERPYDLRHARLSTWLNAGVEPARVAEWGGNSVPVLLRVYAKCLSGTEQNALRKIREAEPAPQAEPEHE
ncbi:MAG TPA: tyrosine-type recombinase/integrase [Streptosporangiaceae bacterium]|nr:tyrosine-type recombinase/integrase [Streptosporangiaceae bacterium]